MLKPKKWRGLGQKILKTLSKFILTAGLFGLTTMNPAWAQAPKAVSMDTVMQEAQNGNPSAQLLLGQIYENGTGVLQDYAQSYHWYNAAAQQGQIDALVQVASFKAEGLGTEKDIEGAFKLYKQAAQSGNTAAMHIIGSMIENELGSKLPRSAALTWYEKAANAGFMESATALGVIYHDGKIIDQDLGKAKDWYAKAAAKGHARAQNNLGLMYSRGEGVEKNYEKAAAFFKAASDKGLKQAYRNLGVLYENGFGVPQSDEKAVELYKLATSESRGSRKTQSLPSDLEVQAYLDGIDHNMRTLKAEALQGSQTAQYVLGTLFMKGRGVPQDYVLAHQWLNLSGAKETRDEVAKRMTTEQLNEAQTLARTFMENR